jgi:superfamily I DNA/RNA helicase
MAYFFKLPPITDLTTGQQSALNDPNPIAISGGPGTGKSVVSLWRHIRNYDLGNNRSLLLTYTKTLERYLSSSAGSENQNAGRAVDRIYRWTYGNGNRQNYSEIIIDEAQDVESDRYNIIKRHSNSISYGADDQQIVFTNRATTQNQLAQLFPENNSYVLTENFRNSYEIMLFIKALFPNKLISYDTIQDLLAKNRRGNKPIILITNHDQNKQTKAVLDIINQFKSDTHNIAILLPLVNHVETYYNIIQNAGIKCSKFTNEQDRLSVIENVHITTFKSSKGTEFDTLIIPDFQDMPNNISQLNVINENDYYVALTRARRNVYLICSRQVGFLQNSAQQQNTFTTEIL